MAFLGTNAAAAWGHFTGCDTNSITTVTSHNVSSISDEGNGAYKVNLSSSLSNYACVAVSQDDDGTGRDDGDNTVAQHNSDNIMFRFFRQQGHTNSGRSSHDPDGFSFIVMN
tara:strand:+ start:576 stop:911 length:336 start_codon:yes stop_codon:yes gene_type:complete